jgi:pimeloyl-ACP methyl ester carboxylesterase
MEVEGATMLIQHAYGDVLTPDWHRVVLRDHHPSDASWIYSTATEAPTGPPLLLLHGVGNDGGLWSPVIPALAARGPVFAPTVAARLLLDEEHGGRAATIDALIEHLVAVTPPPWRIAGHSMGGVLAGIIMRYHPELVERAVLVNSPLPSVTERIRSGDSLDRTGRALLMLKTLAQVTRFGRPRLPRPLRAAELVAVRTALRGFVVDPGALDNRVVSRAIMSTRTRDGMDFIHLARELPELAATPFDGVPVTIVLGRDDPLVPMSDLDDVRALYPSARLEIIERCSHFAHLEQPGRTVELIDEALRG